MAYFWAKSSYSLGKITGFLTWSNYSIVVAFKFHGRRYHGICEAGDWHQRTCACHLRNIVVPAQCCEYGGDKNETYGYKGPGILKFQAQILIELAKHLPNGTDKSAEQKCKNAILQNGRIGRRLLHHLAVLLFGSGFQNRDSPFRSRIKLLSIFFVPIEKIYIFHTVRQRNRFRCPAYFPSLFFFLYFSHQTGNRPSRS